MQKDSSCEKKRSRRGRKPKSEKVQASEKEVETIVDSSSDAEYEDVDIESEVETDEGLMSEMWSSGDSDFDESYETDVYAAEEEMREADEVRKKAAIEERRRIRRENKTINYVNPVEMEKRIQEYYETDVMTEELAMDIRKICDRLSMSARFVNYTYRDEMAGDAFVSAYKAIYNKKYKAGCGFNPFSYITQVAFHSMVQRIKTEHKEREKTDSFREAHYDEYMQDSAFEANSSNESIDSFD